MASEKDKKKAAEITDKYVEADFPSVRLRLIDTIAAALTERGNQVWDEAAQVVHGTLAPFTSDGVKAGVAGISDLLMLALEEAKAKDGGE